MACGSARGAAARRAARRSSRSAYFSAAWAIATQYAEAAPRPARSTAAASLRRLRRQVDIGARAGGVADGRLAGMHQRRVIEVEHAHAVAPGLAQPEHAAIAMKGKMAGGVG